MRHVEHVMGTVVSFDVRQRPSEDPAVAQAVADAVAWLHQVDETFSTYRHDSPVSRLGRGEITLAECPPEVSEILQLCEQMANVSHGYFTAYPGGRLDPSAMVKGWAIDRASRLLLTAGVVDHCINGGGDIQIAGSPASDRPWRIGIAHPLQPATLATVVTAETRALTRALTRAVTRAVTRTVTSPVTSPVGGPLAGSSGGSWGGSATTGLVPAGYARISGITAGGRLAIATSGTAERGAHILDPHTGRPATELASITLVGEHITVVDAYATAAFAMGNAARDWIEQLEGLEAFAVTATGATWQTTDFPNHSAPPSP